MSLTFVVIGYFGKKFKKIHLNIMQVNFDKGW